MGLRSGRRRNMGTGIAFFDASVLSQICDCLLTPKMMGFRQATAAMVAVTRILLPRCCPTCPSAMCICDLPPAACLICGPHPISRADRNLAALTSHHNITAGLPRWVLERVRLHIHVRATERTSKTKDTEASVVCPQQGVIHLTELPLASSRTKP